MRVRRAWQFAVAESPATVTDSIITEARLLEITGSKRRADLRKRLRRAGIPFKECGTIFTTQGALDASMVGHAKKKATPNWDAGHASD